MSQKKGEVVLYIVPLFDCVTVPVSDDKKKSLTLLTKDKDFQKAFDEAVGNAGSDAVFKQFKFLDLGEQKEEGAFLKPELGNHLWVAISSCQPEDFDFDGEFDKVSNSRKSPATKKKEKQSVISEFKAVCDGDDMYDFLDFLIPFVEGLFNSGECKEFREELKGFFDDMNTFMGDDDYLSFTGYENSRPTPADDVVKSVARELTSFRAKFSKLMDTFCVLWEKYFVKIEYVLKEEFDDFKESMGDDLKVKIDSVRSDVDMLSDEVADLRSQVESVRKDFNDFKRTMEEQFEQLKQANAGLQKMCENVTTFLASNGSLMKKVQKDVEQCVRDSETAQSRASEAQTALKKAYDAYGSGHH